MEAVNIHIATSGRRAQVFVFLAKLFRVAYSVDSVKTTSLASIIDKGEEDFATGKSRVMTIDELRALTNEVA